MATTRLLEDWITYWGDMATSVSTRLQTASREIRDRQYTPAKMLSDVLGTWMDGVGGWMRMLRGDSVSGTPVVFFKFPQGTEVKIAPLPNDLPPDTQVEVSDLVQIGGGQARIPATHMKVDRAGDQLNLRLINLGKGPGGYVPAPGHYIGVAHVGENPLAVVHAIVTPR